MNTAPEDQTFVQNPRAYRKYIIPTWIFPLYFITWGLIANRLTSEPPLFWFFVTVGIPFFTTGIYASRARKYMSYWRFVYLTMIVPFLIFAGIGLVLAIGQLYWESFHHR